jgi:hypothetical protein
MTIQLGDHLRRDGIDNRADLVLDAANLISP